MKLMIQSIFEHDTLLLILSLSSSSSAVEFRLPSGPAWVCEFTRSSKTVFLQDFARVESVVGVSGQTGGSGESLPEDGRHQQPRVSGEPGPGAHV